MHSNTIKKSHLYFVLLLSCGLWACDEDTEPQVPVTTETSGIFVVNEGGFRQGNTSISFFDSENKAMNNNIFEQANGRPLGDQSQSFGLIGGKGYILVQNSSKIEVIDANSISSITTIDAGITSPRYILDVGSDRAYVSDWGQFGSTSHIKIINTKNATVIDSIEVGSGANRMIRSGEKVLVANSGGFGRDSVVVFIDIAAGTIDKKVTIGDNPNSIQEDADGNYWIVGSGYTAFGPAPDFEIDLENSSSGFVAKINKDGQILFFESLGEKGSTGPRNLEISPDKKTLYYRFGGATSGDIYKIDYRETSLPGTPFISKKFYGISVHPVTGNLICGEAPDFSSAGNMFRYSPEGTLMDRYAVGIGPSSFTFK